MTNEIKIIECPVCFKMTEKITFEAWKKYILYRCKQCDVVFSHPFVAGDSLWYKESGIYELARFHNKLYWHHGQFLKDPPLGHTILDIGCNNGVFLHHAEKLGYEVTGMDFNNNSLEAGRQAFGLKKLFCCTLEDFAQKFPDEKFDVITVFEVLEHLDHPNDFLDAVKSLLKPSGYIAISVPNRNMMINPLGDTDYPPHHLTKWSALALDNFMKAHGFMIISHSLKQITAEDFARWFDFNIIQTIDHGVRKRLKKIAGKRFEEKWKSGDTQSVPFLYRIRQIELKLLSMFFSPFAAVLRRVNAQGFGQYILAKKKT